MLENVFVTINTWMLAETWMAGLGCFLWGMVSVLFSPCHLASIPLIVGYVGGQNRILCGREAVKYALAFTLGLFLTIAAIGIICSLLGRMLGDVGPYFNILVGLVLVWVGLDMFGLTKCSLGSFNPSRLGLAGLSGALVLGLAYGLLSGSCTFGFIAPILAIVTVQEKILTGILLMVLFGLGHCLPIALAGSSTAAARRIVESRNMQQGAQWFRKAAGAGILLLGIVFVVKPFLS
ncbi:cytochrome c biogenesis CcdA family protein [Desulfoplanes formicivorans]|uniref:Cytochrome C biosynthesis protein n=1 Tax=Desulfoplanes formicivorans TaxID=1592317 RepID=A0A194AGE3_9BACT|nr:cytochrome c biogenesis protein CcdA [Desulfoplanes formicivorans]GAU08280.1 cytochrome C biosynthesis protein [Desulfoplanes formicivorans]